MILKKLHIEYDTLADLIADLKHIDGVLDSLDPTRKRKFVIQDENGEDILFRSCHGWTVTPLGIIEETPAVLDEDGEIVTPAVLSDRPRGNIALWQQEVVDALDQLRAGGYLDGLPNGSSFVETDPITPSVEYVGFEYGKE